MKEYYSEITKELDKYNTYLINLPHFETYIYDFNDVEKDTYVIRVPGATRGRIRVNESNIILSVELYENTAFSEKLGCYELGAKDILAKYIGTKLELREVEWE